MSLINEALQRARDEAARRQAASKGVPLPPVTHARPRSPWMMVAVVFLAGALTVTLLLLAGLAFRPQETGPKTARVTPVEAVPVLTPPVHASQPKVDPPTTAEAREQTPTANLLPATPQQESQAVPAPVSSASDTAISVERQDRPAANVSAQSDPETHEIDSEDPQPVPTRTHQEATRASEAGLPALAAERQVFVRRAVLEGNESIDLGGIAWSGTGPFALLNGKVLGVGESLLGFELVEINPNDVVLQRDLDTIVLQLK